MAEPYGAEAAHFARVTAAAAEFAEAVRRAGAQGQSGAGGQHLAVVNGQTMSVARVPIAAAGQYAEAYRNYCVAAGNAFVAGALPEGREWIPPFFEAHKGRPSPLCVQLGPFPLLEPSELAHRRNMEALGLLVAEYVGIGSTSSARHDVYLGVSLPPRGGPGCASIFAWCPTFFVSSAGFVGMRAALATLLQARAGERPFLTAPDGGPLRTAEGALVGNAELCARLRRLGGNLAGCSGVVPMPWCADPAQLGQGSAPSVLVPYVGYATHITREREGALEREFYFVPTLDDCLGAEGSAFLAAPLRGAPRVEHSNTDAPRQQEESELPAVRVAGCRALNGAEISTYDNFFVIVSSGYAGQEHHPTAVQAIPDNIFSRCVAQTTDQYAVQELLSLFSPERYNTGTMQGMALMAEVLDALVQMFAGRGAQNPKSDALRELGNRAASIGAERRFDSAALAAYHQQNYDMRPPRSVRVIVHYAQRDTPVNFAHLLATRIWSKLIMVKQKTDQVLIAEALATYMMLNHYTVTDALKTKVQLWHYNGNIYQQLPNPTNYISTLLSPDPKCGKLHALLSRYMARLAALGGESAAGADFPGESFQISKPFLDERLRVIVSILEALQTPSYKNTLVAEILTKLDQEQSSFLGVSSRQMGDDIYLTGVTNGTLEVVRVAGRRKIFWRPSTPEDMISRTLNTGYDASVRGTTKWQLIEQYFSRLVADPPTRRWLTCQVAETLIGNNNKIFTYLIGPPDCGKSDFFFLMLFGFMGTLSEALPSNVLSDPKGGQDGPQPALARASSCRSATIEETSETIRNNLYKTFGGGNARTALRGMHVSGGSLVFGAKIFIAMNNLPTFEVNEPAVYTRSGFIEVSQRLVESGDPNLPPTAEERERLRVFAKDPSYSARIRDAYPALLLYLMDHFDSWTNPDGTHANLSSFTAVMKATADKVRAQCPYASFVGRHVMKVSAECTVPAKEVVSRFRKCASSKYNKVPEEIAVAAISRILGSSPINANWVGWALRNYEEALALNNPQPPAVVDDPPIDDEQYLAYGGLSDPPRDYFCQEEDPNTFTADVDPDESSPTNTHREWLAESHC